MSEVQAAYNVKSISLDKQKLLKWLDIKYESSKDINVADALRGVYLSIDSGTFDSSNEPSSIISPEQLVEIQHYLNASDDLSQVVQAAPVKELFGVLLSSEQAWRDEVERLKKICNQLAGEEMLFQEEAIKPKSRYSYTGFLQSCLRSGETWDGTYEDFVAMNEKMEADNGTTSQVHSETE